MTSTEILSAYRNLYRAALHAIRGSTPARYQVRDIVRTAFRHDSPSQFNPRRVANTLKFFQRARDFSGIEHKIIRNILHAGYWRDVRKRPEKRPLWMRGNEDRAVDLRRNLYSNLDATVILLNESMDLCLRTLPYIDDPDAAARNDSPNNVGSFVIRKMATDAREPQ